MAGVFSRAARGILAAAVILPPASAAPRPRAVHHVGQREAGPGIWRARGRVVGAAAGLLLAWCAAVADWEPELAQFEVQARTNPPPAGHVLLLGSSSFRLWTNAAEAFPGPAVVNRGFGGSHYSDLLELLDRLAPPALQPALILVYEGDNDLASGKTPEAVAADAPRLLRLLRMRFPDARTGLLAVKPSPSRAGLLAAQKDLNLRLRRLARQTAGVTFLDTAAPLLGADGQPDPRFYVADRLHMNEAGYDVWRGVLKPFVARTPK